MKKIFWSSLEVLQTVIIAVVAVFLVRTFITQPFLVSGQSMEPTFQDGNYLLVDEVAYRLRDPERGEVVVFRYPGDRRAFYIKRVIGLPGERVVVSGGMVTVYPVTNSKGETLREPDVMPGGSSPTLGGGTYETVLEPDTYFVMGDNRNFSYDSRSWGPLARSEIIGLVRVRLWPGNEGMAFGAPTYP